jgi:xanthine dehydrogenase YagS FAD-binding subunit
VKPFGYECASDVAGAVARVAARPDAAFLAGGTNLVDHMKLGIASPGLLVDVTGLPLNAIESLPGGGVRIGALVRNSDLAADPVIRQRYPMLSQAVLAGASGQLRNMATTGGNLLQRTRCAYFQDLSTPCNKRAPGSGCSAIDGHHREHAILGASAHCIAVNPSDMAVALCALEAVAQVRGPDGERSIPVEKLYRLPGDEPQRDTVLEHGELITAADLPALPVAANSRYRKVRDRASYAFALVSVAVAARIEAGSVRDVRVAFGGLAPRPWRARTAEEVLRGAPATAQLAAQAAEAELAAARPLAGNTFKVTLARGALVAVMRELIAEATP